MKAINLHKAHFAVGRFILAFLIHTLPNLRRRQRVAIIIFALATATKLQSAQSATDLWDVSKGVVVTAYSPLHGADGTPHAYDPRDIFGGHFGAFIPESGNTIFADGFPDGLIHHVKWRLPLPVTLRSFNLF